MRTKYDYYFLWNYYVLSRTLKDCYFLEKYYFVSRTLNMIATFCENCIL